MAESAGFGGGCLESNGAALTGSVHCIETLSWYGLWRKLGVEWRGEERRGEEMG